MKILIAASGFDSPRKHEVNIFALDQAKALRDAGHDVRFAAVDTRSIRHSRPWGCYRYTLDGIPVYYASVPCGALPMGLPERAGRLAASGICRAIAKDGWKPDVIHQHFGFELAAMAEREGIPFVFTEHSSLHNRALSPEKAEHLKRKYECCAAVLAVSRALARNMRANTGVEAVVVPNIVDTARFAPKRIAHERFTFVSAGNLIPVKNMAGLLHAFAALHGEDRRAARCGLYAPNWGCTAVFPSAATVRERNLPKRTPRRTALCWRRGAKRLASPILRQWRWGFP